MNQPASIHVVCAQCATTNRFSRDRATGAPKCGRCGAALLPVHPVELADDTYDTVIARTELPVVVDYWAAWCGPCQVMAPQFEAAARQMHGEVLFAKLNTEEAQRVAAQAGIRSIPTLALFRGGREIARTSGARDAGALVQWIRGAL